MGSLGLAVSEMLHAERAHMRELPCKFVEAQLEFTAPVLCEILSLGFCVTSVYSRLCCLLQQISQIFFN